MNQEKYIQDLSEIKDMMNRSSKFISLSGLSGISSGIVALIGAYLAWVVVYNEQNYQSFERVTDPSVITTSLLSIALGTLLFAVALGIFFTRLKTRKTKQNLWDYQTQRLLINLMIPLISGGILCLILLLKGYVGLIAPLTLIFYGLGLVNASKYTLSEIRNLGLLEIILGLVSTYFVGYGLIFWSLGFGVLHIVYGIYMELKYKS